MPDTALKIAWALLRPQTYLLMCIYVTLGVAYGLAAEQDQLVNFLFSHAPALLGVFVGLALWYIAGTALNDYADYEIDKINLRHDKQRPLVQGLASHQQLLRYAQLATVGAFVVILLTNTWPVLLLFCCLFVLNIVYSLKPIQLSHRGGLAPLLLPLGYIVLTVNAGLLLTQTPYDTQVILFVVAMYLHFMARIILKDHRDVRGDAKAGKKTLVLKYGNKTVIDLSIALFTTSTILLAAIMQSNAPKAIPFMVLFAGSALATLAQLRQENRWPYQKPLITIFGRFCSGIVTIMIVGLLPHFVSMSERQLMFTLVIVSVIFFGSIFGIIRLQHPTQPTTS